MEINFSKISDKINKLPISGKVLAGIKIFLFIDIAVIIGIWLGIKLFFPDDFVLSKINEQLFLKDLTLLSEDINISLLGNISFEEGTLMQKGDKVLTFSKLSFSPEIFKTLGGHPAGTVYLKDMNSQGGELEASFETNENPCYTFNSQEVPLSTLKPFSGEIVITGALTGNGEICRQDNKYNGTIDLKGDDIILRGKVPTPMGDLDVGKIILGEIELAAEIINNKADIKNLAIKGVFELNALGKITLNTKNFLSSRLDLNIKAKVPDMKKIEENVVLNLLAGQLSQYKGEEKNSFALTLKGFLNKPQTGKMTKERDPKNEMRPQKPERPQFQRQSLKEKLPQKVRQNDLPAAQENQNNTQTTKQDDELKKKEDELKRKEDELRRKEEDTKEREEKMREEREQREREEKERREQEEKKRMEEEARIHAAQEEAMNEIRKAREEIEAERLRNNTQVNENEEEIPKPSNDEIEEEE